MRVPVEAVVDGVIDAAVVFAAKADVECRHAGVLQEWREVRAGAERVDAQVGARASLGVTSDDASRAKALRDRNLCLGIFDVARHFIDEALERVRATDAKRAAPVPIG